MTNDISRSLFEAACRRLPGGVNSPVRAFGRVGGTPHFIARGEGAYIVDADGNRFIDYVLSWGPLILGHAHPEVVAALQSAAANGTSFGAPTALETELAELVCQLVPSIEQLRFVNSGTEATMSAIRLARAATGRDKIIKFDGCYHGHADMLLVKAGSGVATLGLPDSPGVPGGAAKDTLVADYNDLASVAELFDSHPGQLAAIIVEPVAGNMGVVPPADGFLDGLRRLADAHGALLILDEVMTGFRVALGGAQAHYGITPDLTVLGKVIGGGLPVAAYGGRRDLMQHVAPQGSMYQAGTLSGNPLAMSAGLKTLELLSRPGYFAQIADQTRRLAADLGAAAAAAAVPVQVHAVGTMFSLFFSAAPVRDWNSVAAADTDRFKRYFHAMLERGVYLAPSPFEAGFVSSCHSDDDIAQTVSAAADVFAEL